MTRSRAAAAACAALLGALAAAPARPLDAQSPVFAADSPLAVTLRTNFTELLGRRDDSTTWRRAELEWTDGTGTHAVPLELRQRGHYRLLNCDLPPLRLKFDADSVRGTPWAHTRRPKLVVHCRNTDEYEQYVLSEYAVYRLWSLVAPVGFQVRLLRVTYQDTDGRTRGTRYAMLVEDPDRFAERVGGSLLEIRTVRQSDLRVADVALLATFQYLIGNADWSVPGLHNVQLVRMPDTVIAVPFDFDWTGVVDARYAHPGPQLPVRTIRDRIWRGLCLDSAALEPALARFDSLRDSIATLYRAVPGMSRGTLDRTLRYFGDFYEEIEDRRWFLREKVRPRCLRG